MLRWQPQIVTGSALSTSLWVWNGFGVIAIGLFVTHRPLVFRALHVLTLLRALYRSQSNVRCNVITLYMPIVCLRIMPQGLDDLENRRSVIVWRFDTRLNKTNKKKSSVWPDDKVFRFEEYTTCLCLFLTFIGTNSNTKNQNVTLLIWYQKKMADGKKGRRKKCPFHSSSTVFSVI